MPGLARSVRVTRAGGERRPLAPGVRWLLIGLVMVLVSAGVVLAARLVLAGGDRVSTPPTTLDARSVAAQATGTPVPDRQVPHSTRLTPVGPDLLLDTRTLAAPPAGTEVPVPLPPLPEGTTAVLVEVSVVAAAGPGEVTIGSGAARSTVLRVARARAQQTATVVAHLDPDGQLHAGVSGGGHLVVQLVGVFEPAQVSGPGRVVAVPATRVARLVPRTDGKDAQIQLSAVPQLAQAGPVSAVLLQVSADVGPRGGFVAAGSAPDDLDQTVFWSATGGGDRTRGGLLFVPVTGGSVHLRYEAGTELRADLIGYVTGDGAPEAVAGLVVPAPPQEPAPVRVPARTGADLDLSDAAALADLPADRVAAALLTVTAAGDAVGGVTVRGPGSALPGQPTLVAAQGTPRSALTLVPVAAAVVRVDSAVDASVTLVPRLLVLTG